MVLFNQQNNQKFYDWTQRNEQKKNSFYLIVNCNSVCLEKKEFFMSNSLKGLNTLP